MLFFLQCGSISPHPTTMLEVRPLSAVRDCLFIILFGTTLRLLFHPQPEDAPCRGEVRFEFFIFLWPSCFFLFMIAIS
jgi:hypothetical protein